MNANDKITANPLIQQEQLTKISQGQMSPEIIKALITDITSMLPTCDKLGAINSKLAEWWRTCPYQTTEVSTIKVEYTPADHVKLVQSSCILLYKKLEQFFDTQELQELKNATSRVIGALMHIQLALDRTPKKI